MWERRRACVPGSLDETAVSPGKEEQALARRAPVVAASILQLETLLFPVLPRGRLSLASMLNGHLLRAK